jgi:hypothetical protein
MSDIRETRQGPAAQGQSQSPAAWLPVVRHTRPAVIARLLTLRLATTLLAVLTVAGCATAPADFWPAKAPELPVHQRERFQTDAPYWRAYAAPAAQVCEGARRALMSQGYVVSSQSELALSARKFFRPEPGIAVELAVQVTCVDRDDHPPSGVAYVAAWQDHFATRKNSNAASVGVNALGSISLPLMRAEDALVKVGVEMVDDPGFYDRFHRLVASMLPAS